MKNLFDRKDTDEVIARINKLTPDTEKLWGSMSPAQMLAHCNVTYEMIYEPGKHSKPKGLMKYILKKFVKPMVVGDKPYRKNGKTAPAFVVNTKKDFETEKKRLIDYLIKTQELGPNHFEGRESHSFGALSLKEWQTMFYKHLDHHLSQFGV